MNPQHVKIHKALSIIDELERNTIMYGYFKNFIYNSAKKYSNNKQNISFDDLYQQGCLGLMQAIKNCNNKDSFVSFACKYINGYVSHSVNNGIEKYSRLHCDMGEDYNIDQYFDPVDQYELIFKESDKVVLLEAIHTKLEYFEQLFIEDFYYNDLTISKIAKKYGKSENFVCKTIKNALSKIKEEI